MATMSESMDRNPNLSTTWTCSICASHARTFTPLPNEKRSLKGLKERPQLKIQIQKLQLVKRGVVTNANATANKSQGGHVINAFNKKLMEG